MRKLMAVLVALMLLALPAMGSALTIQEASAAFMNAEGAVLDVRFEAGDLSGLSGDADAAATVDKVYGAIGDLLNALGLHVEAAVNLSAGSMALTLSGQKAVTLDWVMDNDKIALKSVLTGDKPIAFGWEELRQMTGSGSGANFDFQAYWNGVMEYVQQLNGSMTSRSGSDALNSLLPATMQAVAGLWEKAEKAPVTEQPADCDPAAEVWTLNLTRADLLVLTDAAVEDILALPFVQPILNAAGMDMETAKTKVHTAAEEGLEKFTEPVTVIRLVDEDGETVRLSAHVEVTQEEKPAAADILVTRNSREEAVVYGFALDVQAEGVTVNRVEGSVGVTNGAVQMGVTVMEADDEGALHPAQEQKAYISWTEEENRVVLNENTDIAVWSPSYDYDVVDGSFVSHKTYSEEPTVRMHQDVDYAFEQTADGMGWKGTAKLSVPSVSENVLLTVIFEGKTTPAPAPMDTTDAVYPLQMSKEDQQAFAQQLMTNVQISAMGLMRMLPDSVLQLLMQGGF